MSPATPNFAHMSPAEIEAQLSPLDFAMFELLPDEGSTLGFHPRFKSVQALAKELTAEQPPEAPPIRSSFLASRMRGLKMAGLAVPVAIHLSGRTDGWQRTARAVELLAKRQAGQS